MSTGLLFQQAFCQSHEFMTGKMMSMEGSKSVVGNSYVTGFAKTNHNVTLGQLHFIGPANSHTHTLPMHCCIDGLSWLVCFSGAGFADHVKSRLRQWGPWRALDGRYGSDIHPCVGEASLKALQACLSLWLAVLGLTATPNSPIIGAITRATCDITVVVKKLLKTLQC